MFVSLQPANIRIVFYIDTRTKKMAFAKSESGIRIAPSATKNPVENDTFNSHMGVQIQRELLIVFSISVKSKTEINFIK